MNTYKAVGTIHTAEPTRDPAEMDRRNKPGGAPETKILTPGTFFNPDEHHLSKDDVARLEARGVIAKLEGADQQQQPETGADGTTSTGATLAAGVKATGGENRTEGSGATGQGTRQEGAPGVDSTGKAGPQQAGGAASNVPIAKK